MLYAAAGDSRRAYAEARAMAERGASALVSFGVAGGLDPTLQSGDIIIASGVIDETGKYAPTDDGWRDAVLSAIGNAQSGMVYGSDHALSDIAEKQAAFSDYGAVAVDMESHGVARAAHECDLPFLIVRAIADTAATALPDAVRNAIGVRGERRALPVIIGLLRRPAELSAVLSLSQESAAAMKALDWVAPTLLTTAPEQNPNRD